MKKNSTSIPSDFVTVLARVFDKSPKEVEYIQNILKAEFGKHEPIGNSANEFHAFVVKKLPSIYSSLILSPGCQDALLTMIKCYKDLPHTTHTRLRGKKGENSITPATASAMILGTIIQTCVGEVRIDDGDNTAQGAQEDQNEESDDTGAEDESDDAAAEDESSDQCFPTWMPGHGG